VGASSTCLVLMRICRCLIATIESARVWRKRIVAHIPSLCNNMHYHAGDDDAWAGNHCRVSHRHVHSGCL